MEPAQSMKDAGSPQMQQDYELLASSVASNEAMVELQRNFLKSAAGLFSSPIQTGSLPPPTTQPTVDAASAAAVAPPSSVAASRMPPPLHSPTASGPASSPIRAAEQSAKHLVEARDQAAASLATLSAHAANLETQLRAQASALARAEAARADAVAQQAGLAHEVASLSEERAKLAAQLDHYMSRADDLVAEKGRGAGQLAELTRELAEARAKADADAAASADAIAALERERAERDDAAAALEEQNASLRSDLREVTTLIDQLEGEPGFVRAMLRKRPGSSRKPPAAGAQAAVDAKVSMELSVATSALRASLEEIEDQAAASREGMLSSEAAQLLREENDLLQAQLELISEKMYGSPAKSAARERDRLAAELDRERSARLTAEDACGELDEELQKAHGRIRELEARLHAEGSMRADLERTRRALHAAQTNAALGLMRGADSQASRRVPNPIAAPRHQFGGVKGGRANTPTTSSRSSSTPRTAR